MYSNISSDPKLQENLQILLARTATDLEFRAQLISDPRTAIAEHYHRDPADMPADFDIVFIENTADATIVLPDPVDPSAELSAEELEAVAGGILPLIAASLGVVASAIWAGKEVKNLGDDNAWLS